MPWTASARGQYARPAARHATDLTDAEFTLVAPHLPAPSRIGRPREVDLREVLDAIFYLLRTGCPWRLLPREFPPRSTVFGYFRRLWEDGTWPTLHALLVMAAREQAGREASPTADIQDRDGLALVCRRLRRRFPWLRLSFADGGYRGETAACAAAREGLRLTIVTRDPGTRGLAVLPRRWVVERTFAWLGRNRRLAKDFETTITSAVTMAYLASVQLLLRRLARA